MGGKKVFLRQRKRHQEAPSKRCQILGGGRGEGLEREGERVSIPPVKVHVVSIRRGKGLL